MNIKKLGMGSLMLMMVLSLSAVGFAFPLQEYKEEMKEHRSSVRESLTSGDYSLWQSAWNKVSQLAMRIAGISEEKFDELAAKVQERKKVREDRRESVDAAIEAKDYDAFVVAVQGSSRGEALLEKVSSDNFAAFAELHAAREAGNHETARALAGELGLERPNRRGGSQRGVFRGRGYGAE